MPLTRRTQILLDEHRHARLQRRAAETGRSVGSIIREAIDEKLGAEDEARLRREAGQRLLAAAPMPVGDWEDVEREIEGMYERHDGS